MAGTAVLEREIAKEEDVRKEERAAASEHFNRISENYKRIFSDAAAEKADVLVEDRPAPAREAHAETAGNDFRNLLADYRPVTADPASRHALFEGLEYKEGELIGDLSAYVQTQSYGTTEAPEAPAAASEEDAMPTPRTMGMLASAQTQAAARAEEQTEVRTGVFAKLSASLKVALAIVCSAIVVAFVLVCVNSGIIRSLNAQTQSKQTELDGLRQRYTQVQDEIDAVKDPENIAEWAQSNGYTRG